MLWNGAPKSTVTRTWGQPWGKYLTKKESPNRMEGERETVGGQELAFGMVAKEYRGGINYGSMWHSASV